jgi:23S rRNA (cytidine2498-2'-O)-methyltransferase
MLDVRDPEQVVSIVCGQVADTAGSPNAYIGLSPTAYNLSDWAGGMRRFARDEKQVSRSEFKLLEALEVFGLRLEPRSVALDLGASPGGWTRILRLYQQYVTAVDPGELHPSVAADPGVRHKRMTAQAYLQDDPDQFDLIVNDMRMDARDSARLMNEYVRCLYREGQALMTLKLPEIHSLSVLEHALRILEEGYIVVRVKHLFHNRSEVTALLVPRST